MHVESVFFHPVKATKGIPVGQADVELSGLRNDRRWAIVDLAGKRLNATHHDTLLAVTATPDDAGNLTLSTAGRVPQFVPIPVGGPFIPVNVSRFSHAVDAGDEPLSLADAGPLLLSIGGVPYRFAEHCDRCVVTTIDPQTLLRGKDPIRALAAHRKWDGKTWFGIRIIPLSIGTLAVGDAVTVE